MKIFFITVGTHKDYRQYIMGQWIKANSSEEARLLFKKLNKLEEKDIWYSLVLCRDDFDDVEKRIDLLEEGKEKNGT